MGAMLSWDIIMFSFGAPQMRRWRTLLGILVRRVTVQKQHSLRLLPIQSLAERSATQPTVMDNPNPNKRKRAQVSKPETSAASASGAKVSVPVHTEESPQVPPTAGPTGEQAESDDAKPEPESNPAPKKRVRCKKPPATTDQVQAAWKLKETRGLCVFSLTNMGQWM